MIRGATLAGRVVDPEGKGVSGARVSYVLGDAARVWALLDKMLPEGLRLALTRRLIGNQSQAS